MTDREDAHFRGPVQTVSTEYASIDPQTNDWGPFTQRTTLAYDMDGQLEGRVQDDGVISTTFDDRGLRTTVSRWPPRIPRKDGMEYGIALGADPRVLTDVLTPLRRGKPARRDRVSQPPAETSEPHRADL